MLRSHVRYQNLGALEGQFIGEGPFGLDLEGYLSSTEIAWFVEMMVFSTLENYTVSCIPR